LSSEFEAALAEYVSGVESVRDLVTYAVETGHRTRPVGTLLSCGAAGGHWRDALAGAVGVELLHKSSVIRDDIADGDTVRGGRPSFHAAHGLASAIVVSDVLWTGGVAVIAASTPSADESLRSTTEVLREMAVGQAEDVFPSALLNGASDRLTVAEQKTGSLSGFACRVGALAGGGTSEQVLALTNYGRKLGTAFQVLNDVRNLSGEETRNATGSDVRKHRDTVLSAFGREAEPSLNASRGRDLSSEEVERERERLLALGAAEFGERTASRLLDEARQQLSSLPRTTESAILASLAAGVLREHAF
jgi:geranylgeranyl diphosphate synthase type I